MTPDEFDKLTQATARTASKAMVTAFTPHMLHMLQQRGTDKFDGAWETVMDAVARCVASQVGSFAMSLGTDYETARGLNLVLLNRCCKASMELVAKTAQGVISPEVLDEYDIASGKPVNFDFREHLKGGTPS